MHVSNMNHELLQSSIYKIVKSQSKYNIDVHLQEHTTNVHI